ncbi:MAG: preprotein translocase subunit YajC, partial [Candidatus Neomarinimicrobiota bacterium]|nr:preprotein translocase subunit YajC [Candidatus Neomarinimicrobiota bacterium]
KEKEAMREGIKKGDKVITMGGIYGTVQGFKEKGRQAVIKVDNNTNITINRTAIAGLAGKVKDEELEQA